MGLRVMRRECKEVAELLLDFRKFMLDEQRPDAVEPALGGVRSNCGRTAKPFRRLASIPLVPSDEFPNAGACLRDVGVQSGGLLIGVDRRSPLPHAVEGDGKVIRGAGKIGLESDRLPEAHDRRRQAAGLEPGDAEFVMCGRIIRVEPHRLFEHCDGGYGMPAFDELSSALEMGEGRPRGFGVSASGAGVIGGEDKFPPRREKGAGKTTRLRVDFVEERPCGAGC